MNKRGRPTKLTPELHQRIITFLGSGAYLETAAAAAGCSKQSLYDWMKRGAREKEGIHRDFLDAVEKAQATAEIRDVALIAKAAERNWQAAAWRLERRAAIRWGRQDRMKLEGEDGGPVQVTVNFSRTPKKGGG
jgi:transposase